MKLDLEINNQTKTRVNKKLIDSVISDTLKKSELKFLNNKKISISFAFVGKKEIRRLNKIYRRKDKITDILSFCEYQSISWLKKEKKDAIFLGELVICFDDIKDYTKREKLDARKELAKIISHGVLHLLGFKHSKKMFAIQEKVSSLF